MRFLLRRFITSGLFKNPEREYAEAAREVRELTEALFLEIADSAPDAATGRVVALREPAFELDFE